MAESEGTSVRSKAPSRGQPRLPASGAYGTAYASWPPDSRFCRLAGPVAGQDPRRCRRRSARSTEVARTRSVGRGLFIGHAASCHNGAAEDALGTALPVRLESPALSMLALPGHLLRPPAWRSSWINVSSPALKASPQKRRTARPLHPPDRSAVARMVSVFPDSRPRLSTLPAVAARREPGHDQCFCPLQRRSPRGRFNRRKSCGLRMPS